MQSQMPTFEELLKKIDIKREKKRELAEIYGRLIGISRYQICKECGAGYGNEHIPTLAYETVNKCPLCE